MRLIAIVAGILTTLGVLTWANWPVEELPSGVKADRVVIEKGARTLTLLRGSAVIRQYRVSLGRAPVGPKEREGDKKTPEGIYRIVEHKQASAFHRALRVSYPGEVDVERARKMNVDPGSDIMIHGIRNGLGVLGRLHRLVDWTAGCIALTDAEIEQIYAAVPDGTVVEIRK